MKKILCINSQEPDGLYTFSQLLELFGISEQELKKMCDQLGIRSRPKRVKDRRRYAFIGGYTRSDVQKLYNALYHESRGNKKAGDSHKEG